MSIQAWWRIFSNSRDWNCTLEAIQGCFTNRGLREIGKRVKENLAFLNIKGLIWLYLQSNCISIYNIVSSLYSFIFWNDLIETSYINILPVEGACNCCRYGSQVLLWRCSLRRWQISCKDGRIDRECNGTSEKGTLLNILQTSPCLWSRSWDWIFVGNSSPLWQQPWAWDVDWKTSYAHVLYCE
jgi:hypothetical protein